MCACLPVLAAPVHHTGPSVRLSVFPSLNHSLPPFLALWHTHTQAFRWTRTLLQGSTTDAYQACMQTNTHVLDVAQFGAKWEQEVVKRLKGCRAWWVKEGIHLYISPALMLLRTSSVFVSHSPTLSMYLSLCIHIYCRNTVEVWGLHHRCSRALRMAEWERKGMDCQNPKPLICHACPQGPLKRQWRHLK